MIILKIYKIIMSIYVYTNENDDKTLEAKKQRQTVKVNRDKTYYENNCKDLDQQIDSEVYKLYELIEKVIKIVERKN